MEGPPGPGNLVMSNQAIALMTVAGGVLLLVAGLFTDRFGLGSHPGYGWTQILCIALGFAAIAAGISLYRKSANGRHPAGQPRP